MASQARRHIDYLKKFSDMQVPIIPGTVSFIDPKSKKERKGGKTPGEYGPNSWFPSRWREYGKVYRQLAVRWDKAGAGIGLRMGVRGHHGLDVDIPEEGLARTVREFLIGKGLTMIRRVEHPQHHKFLCLFRIIDFATGEPINLHKLILTFIQPNGQPGKIELLGDGQQFVADGIHQDRLTPYVWNRHPVDEDVPEIYEEDWRDLLLELRDILALAGATNPQIGSAGVAGGSTPPISQNRVSEEELPILLGMIANDARFTDRKMWMAMFHAIWVATDGLPYGREAWQAWCDTIEQEQPDEPARVWDAGAVNPNSPGRSKLLEWAAETGDPAAFQQFQLAAAQASFDDLGSTTEFEEPAFVTDILTRLEQDWVYIGSEHKLYHVPSGVMHTPASFATLLIPITQQLRLAWGARAGKDKPVKGALYTLFCRYSPERIAHTTSFEPGKPLLYSDKGARYLNLWTPLPRPLAGKAIDPALIARYFEHCVFILGSQKIAILWLKWHAFLLQHPTEQPGWHWLIMGKSGIGKDLMLLPFVLTHQQNRGYYYLRASALKSQFNGYVAHRLVEIAELKQMSEMHDIYTELKTVLSQSGFITINRKNREEAMIPNVVACVMFSNETIPIYIDRHDRRLYVHDCYDINPRDAGYYTELAAFAEAHAAEIAEYCYQLELSTADLLVLQGRAPDTLAKTAIADETMTGVDYTLRQIGQSLAAGSDIELRPVFTAADILQWLRNAGVQVAAAPRYLKLYASGFRPVCPAKDNPRKGEAYKSKILWRVDKWQDSRGRDWDLSDMRPELLYRLYKTGKVGPTDLDDEADEAGEV